MFRRLAASLAVFAAVAAVAPLARAQGWMHREAFTPTAARVAVAVSPLRTTVWTSARFSATAGPVVMILPLARGASADIVSDAWFEALDLATAARTGAVAHERSPIVLESAAVDGAEAALAWGEDRGLSIDAASAAMLRADGGGRFLMVRFDASDGGSVAPTVRVVTPASTARLPLSITTAGDRDLPVSAWVLGEGQGEPEGLAIEHVDPARVVGAVLVGDGLAPSFFERAAAYADEPVDLEACDARAFNAFGADARLAIGCPEGRLIAEPCAERMTSADVATSELVCGSNADDLAVGLAGARLDRVWVTRYATAIHAGAPAAASVFSKGKPSPVVPGVAAASTPPIGGSSKPPVVGGSPPMSGTIPMGMGQGAGGGTPGAPMQGQADTAQAVGETIGELTPIVASGCGSSLDGSSCDGDSSSSDSSCSGDSSSSSSSCSGDSSSSSCSGDSSSSSCSGDSSSGCSGDSDNTDCRIGRVGKPRVPRLTPALMGLLALLAPLRRRGTLARAGRRARRAQRAARGGACP